MIDIYYATHFLLKRPFHDYEKKLMVVFLCSKFSGTFKIFAPHDLCLSIRKFVLFNDPSRAH